MSATSTIFFDLDGVLLDVAERHCRVHRDALRALGGNPPDDEAYWKLKRAGESLSTILAASGNSALSETAYRQQFLGRIEAIDYLRCDTLLGHPHLLLRELAASRPIGLVTLRQHPEHLHEQLAWLGLAACFSAVQTGRATAGEKDWEVKRALIQRSGLVVPGAAIVGDTETDILAGKSLGLITVAVRSGLRNTLFLQARNPDYLLESIDSLPTILNAMGP